MTNAGSFGGTGSDNPRLPALHCILPVDDRNTNPRNHKHRRSNTTFRVAFDKRLFAAFLGGSPSHAPAICAVECTDVSHAYHDVVEPAKVSSKQYRQVNAVHQLPTAGFSSGDFRVRTSSARRFAPQIFFGQVKPDSRGSLSDVLPIGRSRLPFLPRLHMTSRLPRLIRSNRKFKTFAPTNFLKRFSSVDGQLSRVYLRRSDSFKLVMFVGAMMLFSSTFFFSPPGIYDSPMMPPVSRLQSCIIERLL